MSDRPDPRLRRALSNARVLADELARRDSAGTWTQHVSIRPEFSATTAQAGQMFDARGRQRAAVVCWDLGHNPAGRAMMLADLHLETMRVDLVGPLWSRFSTSIWSPIEQGEYSTVTFPCDRMLDFAPKAYSVAAHRKYDLVHVCKPRLPGLILGAMIARASGCPIIVDIDDEEQAFFANADAFETSFDGTTLDLADLDLDELHEPTEAAGTGLGISLARHAATRTVSNVELLEKYGGITVRHARDERKFDPATIDRSLGRAGIGAADNDFVVLFVGTPRPHKGLDVVVEALRQLDDRFVLHVVGVPNPGRFREELDSSGARVVTHPPSDIDVLPELLSSADAIALMQHLDDPISQFQIPSKISDGLAMGCPVIISDAPPMRDLEHHGLLRADNAEQLAAHLIHLAAGDSEDARARRRNAFLGEFSVAANAGRVSAARHESSTARERGEDRTVGATLDLTVKAYAHERRAARPDLFDMPDPEPSDGADVVVFWKQNDTGIYGRRSDMLTKHFGNDQRVRRVLHIDKPLSTERAERDAMLQTEGGDHAPLLSQALLDRRLGIIEAGKVHHRTFLHSESGTCDPISGEEFASQDGFADFVLREMTSLGMDPATSIAWVCPVVLEFAAVQKQLKFRSVVVDVIDDQRAFNHTRDVADELDRSYRELLGMADAVFTNCEPNVAAFAAYAPNITVVPNGAETTAFNPERAPLGDDTRPVIAYVGNMSDRVDWALLDDLVKRRPDYRFLMVGSAHYGANVFELVERHDNVELVGVVPYAELPVLFRSIDVGLVPHLAGSMTERMNPLKVYNYISAGLPVVSTPIPNIDELLGQVSVQRDAQGFATAIDQAVEQRRAGTIERPTELLQSIDWSTRASTLLDQLEKLNLLSA